MQIDLNDLNPFVTFSHPEGGEIDIRALPYEESRRIQKETSQKKVEYRKGQRYEYFIEDQDASDEAAWDYVIGGWRGINSNGEDIPCTLENKVKLMRGSVKFATWVADSLEEATRMYEENKKKPKKTSSSISEAS